MKLRSIISLGAVAGLALSAVANYESPNTFGILAIPDSTSSNLIISVPWVDCANASQATFVSNVVKTTNLKDNDYLIYKSGNTYYSWVLSGSQWTPQKVVMYGNVESTPAAGELRVSRGSALWLHRSDPANSTPVYLFGQYTTDSATTTITAGMTTMVANPGTTDLKISAISGKFTSGGPAKNDRVMVNTASGYKTYTYNGTVWTYKTTAASSLPALPGGQSASVVGTETVTDSDVIPAGKGFWYQSKTGAGTITW